MGDSKLYSVAALRLCDPAQMTLGVRVCAVGAGLGPRASRPRSLSLPAHCHGGRHDPLSRFLIWMQGRREAGVVFRTGVLAQVPPPAEPGHTTIW